jgi:hypothetical protein
MIIKSPFIIEHNFISPQQCERIIKDCNSSIQGNIPGFIDETLTDLVLTGVEQLQDKIFETYNISINDVTKPVVNIIKQNNDTEIGCDNSRYLRKKWVRLYAVDLTGIVFFNDTNFAPPFDTDYEVYGGKLEFPQHQFGFNSKRGVMIMFPSGPHFVNKFTMPEIGNLYYAKFNITADSMFLYQPSDFPGDYTNWFKSDL